MVQQYMPVREHGKTCKGGTTHSPIISTSQGAMLLYARNESTTVNLKCYIFCNFSGILGLCSNHIK